MIIPKPGKVKLPKPGKMKLRVPQINNAFLKKNLITLIAIAALLIGSGTAYGTLSTRTADHGYDPVDGVNQDRYQVLVSGKGYKLSKQQEKNYKLQKKQNKVNAAQAAQNAMNPTTIRTASGIRTFRTSSYRFHYKRNATTVSGIPSIRSDFRFKSKSKTNWTAGDEISFKVGALKYPYTTKKYIPEDDLKLSNFGGTLTYTGSEDGFKLYTWKLGEGTNKIIITATDKKNKKTATWQGQIIAGKGSSQTQQTTKPSSTKPSKTKPGKTKPGKTDDKTTTPPKEEKAEVDVGFGLKSANIPINKDTTSYDVLSKTPNIGVDTNTKEVIYVEGDMSGLSLKKCFKNYEKEKDKLKDLCKSEKADDIEGDKSNHDGEITQNLTKEFSDKPISEMEPEELDELNEYIEKNYDDYYMNHYFDSFFDGWLNELETELKDKTRIETGEPFHGDYIFKWKYDDVKGEKVKTKINLRVILEKN